MTSGEHVFEGEVRGGVMAPLFILRPGKEMLFLHSSKYTQLSHAKKKRQRNREFKA